MLNYLQSFFRLVIDSIVKAPLIRNYTHCQKRTAFRCFRQSNIINSNFLIDPDYSSSKERSFLANTPTINITDFQATLIHYKSLKSIFNKIFLEFDEYIYPDILFKVATNYSSTLISSTNRNLFSDEIYRFIVNPIIHIPEILDFLLSESFEKTFINHPDLKIANVHLRLSSPSTAEAHTTAFHRDYDSYYTVKLFIPFKSISYPFLEYYPESELVSISDLHYRPRYLPNSKLPAKITNSSRDYSSTDIKSLNFIPTSERQITLIVTYLSHFDYGYQRCNVSNLKLLNNLSSWQQSHSEMLNKLSV